MPNLLLQKLKIPYLIEARTGYDIFVYFLIITLWYSFNFELRRQSY